MEERGKEVKTFIGSKQLVFLGVCIFLWVVFLVSVGFGRGLCVCSSLKHSARLERSWSTKVGMGFCLFGASKIKKQKQSTMLL